MPDAATESEQESPRDLLTKDVIAQVFKADKGQDAELLSFQLKDFCKKGDNYASYITSIICKGTCKGQNVEENYVAKINLAEEDSNFQHFLKMVFDREKDFFTLVLPKLNTVLEPLQVAIKCFPECVYTIYEGRKQILFTKNLRNLGFKMTDRTQGLTEAEVMMTLGTIARVHAGSFIVKRQCQLASLTDIYSSPEGSWFLSDSPAADLYRGFLGNCVDLSVGMLEKIDGQNKLMNWLKNSKEYLMEKTFDNLKTCKNKFEGILHGDFWNNNLLFR